MLGGTVSTAGVGSQPDHTEGQSLDFHQQQAQNENAKTEKGESPSSKGIYFDKAATIYKII